MNLYEGLGILGVSLIWGVLYFQLSTATTNFKDPLTVGVIREGISSFILIILLIYHWLFNEEVREQLKDSLSANRWKTTLTQIFIIALLFYGIGFTTLMLAGQGLSSGVLSVVYCLEPIIGACLSYLHKLPRSSLDRLGIFGMFLGFVGVTMVVYPDLTKPSGYVKDTTDRSIPEWGYGLIALISVTSYGYAPVANKMFIEQHQIPVILVASVQNVFGCLLQAIAQAFIFSIGIVSSNYEVSREGLRTASAVAWVNLISCAITGVISSLIFTWLVQRIGAKASLNTFLCPCIALIIGAFTHEWDGLTPLGVCSEVFGVIAAVAGMACVMKNDFEMDRKEKKRGRKTAVPVMQEQFQTDAFEIDPRSSAAIRAPSAAPTADTNYLRKSSLHQDSRSVTIVDEEAGQSRTRTTRSATLCYPK